MEPKQTEAEFSNQVEGLLDIFKWRWCHFRPAQTQHGWRTALSGYKGFPDYLAVREKRLIFAELKSDEGKATEEQAAWLDVLEMAGGETYLWRPSDWEEIIRLLE